jgi:hypothetical protein
MRMGHVWVLLVVAACQKGAGDRPARGSERGDCREDKTCEVGLLCLSDLCVRPPPADCTVVAETLTSLELGNYAPVEERAPKVAKHRAACDAQRVSKEEGACLDKVRDTWSAAQCVPRMFPESKANPQACGKVEAKIREVMAPQVATYEQNPQMKKYYETALKVMRQSCEEDRWPQAFLDCALANAQPGDLNFYACQQQIPPALQQKLAERLQTAMTDQMR